MNHLKDGYHNPVLSSKFPYPPSSGRILRATPVTCQSGSSRTGDTVDPADIAGGNVRPDHDITVAVQRLKHQIVHALGTQFRVHSREGQRSRAGTLVVCLQYGALLHIRLHSCMSPYRRGHIITLSCRSRGLPFSDRLILLYSLLPVISQPHSAFDDRQAFKKHCLIFMHIPNDIHRPCNHSCMHLKGHRDEYYISQLRLPSYQKPLRFQCI